MDLGELFMRNIGRKTPLSNMYTMHEISAVNQLFSSDNVYSLPAVMDSPELSLKECLSRRRSCTIYDEIKQLTDNDISYILSHSFGLQTDGDFEKRGYPSGGAFYPVDAYVLKESEEEYILYHYDVYNNSLVYFRSLTEEIVTSPHFGKTVTVLFAINAVYSKAKYGELSWLLGLIECGHIAQNIYLVCASRGIDCCGIGGINWELCRTILGKGIYPAYALLLGYAAKDK